MSQDHEFLCQSVAPVLVDEFTAKLWGIYCRVHSQVGASQTSFAITRSDYMLSRVPAGGSAVAGVKQIEFNSYGVGAVTWTSKAVSLHSYLSGRYPHISDVPPQPSHALSEVAQAISVALTTYCRKHGVEPKDACVLHVQGHPKFNNSLDQEVRSSRSKPASLGTKRC